MVGIAWMLAGGAHVALRAAPAPHAGPVWAPSAMAARAACLGRDSVAASTLWMAVVVRFASEPAPADADVAWLRQAIAATTALDPDRAAPWQVGALMLAAWGDLDGHEALLRAAMTHHPHDAFYPVALAMSRLLRGDRAQAAEWLDWAATVDGAGSAWAVAAERLRP